ncbi:MAG: hypothetical protein H7Z43_09440, partial [Clostridia bacterium]|nr:hypothetical protein [Deltaproteobacteria bacterium]
EPPRDDVGARIGRTLRRGLVTTQYALFIGMVQDRFLIQYGANSGWSLSARASAALGINQALDFQSDGAAFRDELRALGERPDVQAWLVALEKELQRAARFGDRVSMFSLTERYADSPAEALRWIAVLLQDVRLRSATDDPFENNVPAQVAEKLRNIMTLFFARGVMAHVDPYPPGVKLATKSFYHFYIPAHLATRMAATGTPRHLALAVATTFNAEYEISQAAVKQEGVLGVAKQLTFGKTSLPTISARSVDQIRGGYFGASFALGVDADPTLLTPTTISHPRDAMHRLYSTMFRLHQAQRS